MKTVASLIALALVFSAALLSAWLRNRDGAGPVFLSTLEP